ncbi:MAG: hypothetical protein K2L19_03175 [Eubacterium sp.]|nr:hypothetical protein [Eubacterium sp.]
MDNITYFISLMPKHLSDIFNSFDKNTLNLITEIRLRRNKPIIIYLKAVPYFISIGGKLVNSFSVNTIIIDDESFDFITDRLCNRSYHTNMHTMIDGYITSKNGSRVGISSTAVYKDNSISSVKDINSINIRIAKEYKDCSRKILNLLYTQSTPSIIVAGAVLSGKTTFLRDFSKLLSSGFAGKYRKVSIVDERCEIASGFDIGINTDVLTGYEKAKGIEIATRTLSPDIIVCDEIGNINELNAIRYGFSTGISFAVSVHMKSEKELLRNHIVNELIATGEFDYIVLLKSFTDEFEIIDLRSEQIENSRNDNDNPFFILPWFNGGEI